jgi:hypothetical protein
MEARRFCAFVGQNTAEKRHSALFIGQFNNPRKDN